MRGQDGGDLRLAGLRVGESSIAPGDTVGERVLFPASPPSVIGPQACRSHTFSDRSICQLTTRSALPRIEYMFDIGSPAAASPSGVAGRSQSPPAKR